jgi:potassium-transporting ATPase KdpC subunit
MLSHLRANFWLLLLTLILSSVLYPLALWGIGQSCFRDQAEGSLILGPDGKPIGSALIAQPFNGDEYFHPRPSAVSYNASASGASNWAASNYQLRDRVARQLGPMVKHEGGAKKGQPVGPDIERWFREDRFQGKPGIVDQWAQAHTCLAQAWAKADPLQADYISTWQKSHPRDAAAWLKAHPPDAEAKSEDLAVPFFVSFSKEQPGKWPVIIEEKADGQTKKSVKPVSEGSDIQAVFFDIWREEHSDVELESVPSDLVMASGSGLDPHITLKGALYQLDRVAAAWAAKTSGDQTKVRSSIEKLLKDKASAPFGGAIGVPLVNVLEVNIALRDQMQHLQGR